MRLIIGLGNPGKEYGKTRHNIGFMCLDALREKLKFPAWEFSKKWNAEVTEGDFGDAKLLLTKPQTYMNSSGAAAAALTQFYKIAPENLWVIYDDVDLALGMLRVRPEGSAGSHNGIKSVIEHLGFQNFPRIRIGIESRGVSAPEKEETASFVLRPFNKEETKQAHQAVQRAAEALLLALQEGLEKSQEKYNGNSLA